MSISFNTNSDLGLHFFDNNLAQGLMINTVDPLSVASYREIAINKKITYAKFTCKISVIDLDISSLSFSAIGINYKIRYLDQNNIQKSMYYCYYPKYAHEINNEADFTVVKFPAINVLGIEISIINNENTTVTISDFGIFYTHDFDIMDDPEAISEAIQEIIDTTGNTGFDLVIPLVASLPDINSVPDGYICRWEG